MKKFIDYTIDVITVTKSGKQKYKQNVIGITKELATREAKMIASYETSNEDAITKTQIGDRHEQWTIVERTLVPWHGSECHCRSH